MTHVNVRALVAILYSSSLILHAFVALAMALVIRFNKDLKFTIHGGLV